MGRYQKSVNLQYNTLVHWTDGTNNSSTKRLMFQVLSFFIKSCKSLSKNPFNSSFNFFHRITKIKIKSFEFPKSIKNYKKNNTRNVRHLVSESFVPSAQRTSILYCRKFLKNFRKISKKNSDFFFSKSWICEEFMKLMHEKSHEFARIMNHEIMKCKDPLYSELILRAYCPNIHTV